MNTQQLARFNGKVSQAQMTADMLGNSDEFHRGGWKVLSHEIGVALRFWIHCNG